MRDYSVRFPVRLPDAMALPPLALQQTFNGTAGNDVFNGTSGNDTFNLAAGGKDTANGKGGKDTFNFGAALTAADTIIGGGGKDVVTLNGDYSGARALTFHAATMVGVEKLVLSGGKFDLTMNDANVADGATLTVDARGLGPGQTLTFDGSAELDGRFNVIVGAGKAVVTGGGDSNSFHMGANLDAGDRIDGGGGDDNAIFLNGDYSDGLVFAPNTIHNIRSIVLNSGHSYFLTLDNGNTPFNQTLGVFGGDLLASDSMIVDGSDETSAGLELEGGAGGDVLLGGGGADFIGTGAGFDVVYAGGGDDTIDVGADFDSNDLVDGGAGNDTLNMSGQGSVLLLDSSTFRNIERLKLFAGANYDLTLGSDAVAPGQILAVDASALGALNTVNLAAFSLTDGGVHYRGGAGAETVTVGDLGLDVVKTFAGDDRIQVLGGFNENTHIDGGLGNDTLALLSSIGGRVDFDSHTLRNVETIELLDNRNYNFATADDTVVTNATLLIDGAAQTTAHLIFDGSKETNGHFSILGRRRRRHAARRIAARHVHQRRR